ncbi:MAG: hypothetical protein FJ224_01955 [Lentisphaerae bacterium]|nr:hypothetical protein [Lentisphaerota bacterium]
MKLLMVICPPDRVEGVREVIRGHGVHAYSELESVTGEGETGLKLGTHVWPERSALLFTAVSDQKGKDLAAALREFRSGLYPGEGLKIFSLPVEEEI